MPKSRHTSAFTFCFHLKSGRCGRESHLHLWAEHHNVSDAEPPQRVNSSERREEAPRTFPASYQSRAWLRESTLQSKMALLGACRQRATERPTLAGWSRLSTRSGNGCELGRHVSTARATPGLKGGAGATPASPTTAEGAGGRGRWPLLLPTTTRGGVTSPGVEVEEEEEEAGDGQRVPLLPFMGSASSDAEPFSPGVAVVAAMSVSTCKCRKGGTELRGCPSSAVFEYAEMDTL